MYYKQNPEIIRSISLKKRKSITGRTPSLLQQARVRAERKGISYNLTREWLRPRLERGVCEVTGIPFVFTAGEGTANCWCPTLDRIDNSKGYTRDNVEVVCWMYNAAKGQTTKDNVIYFAEVLSTRAKK